MTETAVQERPPLPAPAGGRRSRVPRVVRRWLHHGLVLMAAALTVLLAGTVLAALATLAGGAVESGAQQRLARDADGVVQVMADYDKDGASRADQAVRDALASAFGDVRHHVRTTMRAPAARPFDLPVLDTGGRPRPGGGVVVIAVSEAQQLARLTAGEWPAARAGAAQDGIQAALHESLGRRLHAEPGDTVVLSGFQGRRIRLEITGLWRANGREPAVFSSLTSSSGGPDSLALVSEQGFEAAPGLAGDALAGWFGVPDAYRLDAEDLGPLRDRVAAFAESDAKRVVFGGGSPAVEGVVVGAPLTEALDRIGTGMVVARSGMYVPAALLGALAVAALVLTARQLTEHRGTDTALLGARGAGAPRVVATAGAEWAVVAVPAALAAPFLAGPLLAALDEAGLLPGEVPHSALGAAGWTAALLALVLHGCSALLPAIRAARDGGAVAKLRRRGPHAAAFQRAGTDLALAAVAVLGWLQLSRYRSPVAGDAGTGGAASVDPVLVLVPVVITIAATLLTLRMLPLAERGAVRLARHTAGLILPLGGWQVSRRATKHAGPALLMVLALAVGALTTSALTMIDRSNEDRARHSVGADLQLTPDRFSAEALPPAVRHSAYTGLPGIEAATPVVDLPVELYEESTGVTAIDTAEAVSTLRPGASSGPMPALRDDLVDGDLAERLSALAKDTPRAGIALPGRPEAIAAEVTVDSTGELRGRLVLTVQDASGLADTVTAPLPASDGVRHELSVPLAVKGNEDLKRHYPLSITRIGFELPPEQTRTSYDITVHRFGSDPSSPAAPGPEGRWANLASGEYRPSNLRCPGAEPTDEEFFSAGLCDLPAEQPEGGLRAELMGPSDLPSARRLVEFAPLRVGGIALVPALADDALLATGRVTVGDTATVELRDGTPLTVTVVGRIGAVPGFPPEGGRLLVDSRALAASLVQRGGLQQQESFWWLSARDGEPAPAAEAVRRAEGVGTTDDAVRAAERLRGDPLQHGTRGVLMLCLLLAPAFAVIGFTLHAVLSTRERRREFALLRAMGVRRRELTGLLWTEQLLIAVIAVVLGAVLGTAVAGIVVPLVTVDDVGRPVYPEVLAVVPWERVALTAAATAVLITALVTVMSRMLARADLVRVMRAGEQ
ncbi:ABC transporter permease [Streptomyces sp. NPDC051940]|uniref:ABC transporter permease n=1 Tax=Streptomyces sp. NPDC051940 TaxID=3155675 RepID=UPI0034428A55